MNYVVESTMGMEMKSETFLPRILSQGKFLCSYFNPENDVAFIDFIVPDNDNVQGDEIPITTYFFSKWTGMFEVYTEEIMVNKPGIWYDHKTYRRHVTNRFIFSIFKRIDSPITFLQIDSRYHSPESKLLQYENIEVYESFAVMNTDTLLLKLKQPDSNGNNMIIYTA